MNFMLQCHLYVCMYSAITISLLYEFYQLSCCSTNQFQMLLSILLYLCLLLLVIKHVLYYLKLILDTWCWMFDYVKHLIKFYICKKKKKVSNVIECNWPFYILTNVGQKLKKYIFLFIFFQLDKTTNYFFSPWSTLEPHGLWYGHGYVAVRKCKYFTLIYWQKQNALHILVKITKYVAKYSTNLCD